MISRTTLMIANLLLMLSRPPFYVPKPSVGRPRAKDRFDDWLEPGT